MKWIKNTHYAISGLFSSVHWPVQAHIDGLWNCYSFNLSIVDNMFIISWMLILELFIWFSTKHFPFNDGLKYIRFYTAPHTLQKFKQPISTLKTCDFNFFVRIYHCSTKPMKKAYNMYYEYTVRLSNHLHIFINISMFMCLVLNQFTYWIFELYSISILIFPTKARWCLFMFANVNKTTHYTWQSNLIIHFSL